MASAYEPPQALLDELRRAVALSGVAIDDDGDDHIVPATIPPRLEALVGKPLLSRPLAVAVDVYGTLLASVAGEPGLLARPGDEAGVAPEADGGAGAGQAGGDAFSRDSFPRDAFPVDMARRLGAVVASDHWLERKRGIPWPEVDSPSVFARALGLGPDDGARACVAWEIAMNRCRAMPGAAGFLRACAGLGLPVGIVSNAQFYTPLFIEAAFGTPLSGGDGEPGLGFDPGLTLWSYLTGRAKPDRWMFDELASRLAARGVPADRILYVGNDAVNDCAPAGEAGMMTALFCGDDRSFKPGPDEPGPAGRPPATVVRSWDELRRLACT